MNRLPGVTGSRSRGFTLIDVVIALAIVAILIAISFPSYQAYVVRSSRQAAQTELAGLANLQEKIFLNSSSYTSDVTAAYTGQSTGGLGIASGKSRDTRYTYSIAVNGTASSFTITATPASGTSQAADGTLTIAETGRRTWGSGKTW